MHFRYAMLLKEKKDYNVENIIYHLKRSFTKGDQQYESQFWYATFCFLSNEMDKIKESKEIFRKLRAVPIPHEAKIKIRYKFMENNQIKIFKGRVVKKEETYGFVKRDGIGDEIFMHKDHFEDSKWKKISRGDRLSFNIGFNFGGPIALKVNNYPENYPENYFWTQKHPTKPS